MRAGPKTDVELMLDEIVGPRGRPRTAPRTDVMDACVEWIEEGKTLASFCRLPGMPSVRCIEDWQKTEPVFRERVARARLIGFDAIAAETLRIADTMHEAVEITEEVSEDSTVVKTKRLDALGHRKLQIDTRLKLLACWDPRYRAQQRVALGGDPDAPAIQLSDTERTARIQSLLALAAQRAAAKEDE